MKKRINIMTTEKREIKCQAFLKEEVNEHLNRSTLDNVAVDFYMEYMSRKRKVKRENE